MISDISKAENIYIATGYTDMRKSIVSTLFFNTKGIKNVERRRKRIIHAVNKTGFLIK